MKKEIILSFCFTLLSIVTILSINSCNKKIICQSCNSRQPNVVVPVIYKSANGNFQFENTSIWIFDKPTIQENGDTKLDNFSSLDFLNKTNSTTGQPPFMVILYVDKLLSKDLFFNYDNIQAISTFRVQGNLIKHDFYKKSGGDFAKIEKLSIKISLISDNAIEFIRNNIVFQENSSTTVLSITLGTPIRFQSPNKIDYLLKAAKRSISTISGRDQSANFSNTISYIYPEPDGGTNCQDRFCPQKLENHICVRDLEQPYPSRFYCLLQKKNGGGICSRNEYKSEIEKNEAIPEDSIRYLFDDSLHYGTKDFLDYQQYGQKYVYFYYFLSEVYTSKADIALMLKSGRALYVFNSKLFLLLHPSGHENEVLINSRLKSLLIDLFDDYKALYADDYVNAVFQNMIDDLEWAEGKSVQDILNGLN